MWWSAKRALQLCGKAWARLSLHVNCALHATLNKKVVAIGGRRLTLQQLSGFREAIGELFGATCYFSRYAFRLLYSSNRA